MTVVLSDPQALVNLTCVHALCVCVYTGALCVCVCVCVHACVCVCMLCVCVCVCVCVSVCVISTIDDLLSILQRRFKTEFMMT